MENSITTAIDSRLAVIDLTDIASTRAEARRKIGVAIARACREVGFFYIVNHGSPQQNIDRMFEISKLFFDLKLEEKQEISLLHNDHYRGYLPMKMVGNDPAIKGLLLEAFHAWQENAADDPRVLAGEPLHASNVWPAAMPTMEAEVMAYFDQVSELVRAMMKAAALGLNLAEHTFVQYFDEPLSLLRLLHYPPQQGAEEETTETERFGTRPHTDQCAFTLLAQDDTGGLEILRDNGEWIAVPPLPGSYVINLGEVMKIWTNGLFMATPHRVINRSNRERYSIPFFMNPTADAPITPILEKAASGASEPNFHTTLNRERATTSSEILMQLYLRIWPSATHHVEN